MKHCKILTIVLISTMIIGCTQEKPEAVSTINNEEISNEILSAWTDYLDAWKSGDVEKCVSLMTSDDYINMPSLDATTDFQETKEMFINVFANNIIESANYKQTEIFVHADMVYEYGWLDQVWISNASGDTMQFSNRCFSVWKKMEDGTWNIHRWMAQQ